MTRSVLLAAAVACAAVVSVSGDAAAQSGSAAQPGRTLRPFRNEAEYAQFYQRVAYLNRRRREQEPPPPPAAPPAPAEAAAAPSAANDAITSVQTAGVDEGGIVKVSGDYLVVLRRGRLFTVRISGDALEPAAATDAFGPGIDPQGAWYDEMLVSGSMVAVVGYSYRRGGTEIGLFRVEPDGRLTHRSTHHLRSGDYYSSRNYASRLVGGKLVFYSPLPVRAEGGTAMASLPAVRRWGAGDTTFRTTAAPTRIYRPSGPIDLLDQSPTLHTVTVCGIDDEELRCRSTALFGPYGRVFYASPQAIYVWASRYPVWRGGDARGPVRSVVFRMPLDGSAPTGLRVSGGPVDQLSFLESGDGHLNVLVRSDGGGDGMWAAESKRGDVALLRVPLSSFGDGSGAAPAGRYRRLPTPPGGPFQNRFVGDWLLYGTGTGWGRPREGGAELHAVRWAGGGEAATLALPHGVDRIERMGSGALVVGSDGRDLHFSAVRLGSAAVAASRFTRANASQGETRTHGFFYRADGAERGIVGLPVVGGARPGYEQLRRGSAAVTFLRNEDFALREMGDLAASNGGTADDGCRASCVDWYGNARPIFLRGRIFALMGYEIVEGRDDDGRIRELRRVSYAPSAARATR